jgi:hypothetical protein
MFHLGVCARVDLASFQKDQMAVHALLNAACKENSTSLVEWRTRQDSNLKPSDP